MYSQKACLRSVISSKNLFYNIIVRSGSKCLSFTLFWNWQLLSIYQIQISENLRWKSFNLVRNMQRLDECPTFSKESCLILAICKSAFNSHGFQSQLFIERGRKRIKSTSHTGRKKEPKIIYIFHSFRKITQKISDGWGAHRDCRIYKLKWWHQISAVLG